MGKTKHTRTCKNCNATHTYSHILPTGEKIEDIEFTSLPVAIEDNEPSVVAAIEAFQAPEIVEYKCEEKYNDIRCTGKESSWETKIVKWPEVMVVHVKKFVKREGMALPLKKYTEIVYPKKLQINEERVYDLFAMINHQGVIGGGHYVIICKNNISDKWYCFNDDQVTEVQVKDVLSGK